MTQDPVQAVSQIAGLPEGTQEDKELALAFQQGEKGAYQAIHDRYEARVQRICRRMLANTEDAQDAAQETFLRTYTALVRFNGRYQLGAWIARIATNVCLDHLRGRGRRPAETGLETFAESSAVSEKDSPEATVLRADEHDRVRSVLAGLPPMHRAAIVLREFEMMSYSDIAVALAMTEPQVKALLHRARKSFKRSWSSTGIAAFLPWRLVARLRRATAGADAPVQMADAASSSVHVATSCSTLLQQCGAFITERVATAVAAVVVGAAAVGAAVPAAGSSPGPQPRAESSSVSGPRAEVKATRTKARQIDGRQARSAQPEPAPAEELVPAGEPSPAPTPSPAPQETPADGNGSPSNTTGQKPPPEPENSPLETYFGWDRGEPIPAAQATANAASVDCAARSLHQRVESLMSDGSLSYRAVFEIESSPTTSRVSFTLWKDAREYRYSSWGSPPSVEWSDGGSETLLEITGEYGALYGSDPEEGQLPSSGNFNAALTLDCAAQSVITEGAVFTAE